MPRITRGKPRGLLRAEAMGKTMVPVGDEEVVIKKEQWEEGREAIRVLSKLDEGALHPVCMDVDEAQRLVEAFQEWMVMRAWRRQQGRSEAV